MMMLTLHALARAAALGLTRAEVVDLVEHADVTYPSAQAPECLVARRGALYVIYNPAQARVVTVSRVGLYRASADGKAAMTPKLLRRLEGRR